jgi:hypothetical protein
MYISTLRKIIEAMGGRLDIRAVLPNAVVRINQFEVCKPAPPHRAAGDRETSHLELVKKLNLDPLSTV